MAKAKKAAPPKAKRPAPVKHCPCCIEYREAARGAMQGLVFAHGAAMARGDLYATLELEGQVKDVRAVLERYGAISRAPSCGTYSSNSGSGLMAARLT